MVVASDGRDSKLNEDAKTIAAGDEITSAFLIFAARRSTLARFILLDTATFDCSVTRIKATRHVTQVAIGVSLDFLRHVVIGIDFFALISIGDLATSSRRTTHGHGKFLGVLGIRRPARSTADVILAGSMYVIADGIQMHRKRKKPVEHSGPRRACSENRTGR
jgi:hypothetical protein